MAIYVISHSDPDCYAPTYLEGPEVEDWESHCNQFMDEITAKAIQFSSKGEMSYYGSENSFSMKVGEAELCEATVAVMESKGYKKIKFSELNFCWQGEWQENPHIEAYNLQCNIDDDKECLEDFESRIDEDPDLEGSISYLQDAIVAKTKALAELKEKHPEIDKK